MAVSKILDHGGTATSTAATTSQRAMAAAQTAGSSLLLIAACNSTTTLTGVTDAKGNTWVVRKNSSHTGGNITVSLADCLAAATPLASGDLITATGASAVRAIYVVEFTALAFDSVSNGGETASTSSAGTGGAVTAVADSALALGVFAILGAISITTPGAGYTNQTGIATTGTIRTVDWESKIATATAGVAETATATYSGNALSRGITALYRDNAAAAANLPRASIMVPSSAAILAATR